jgi:ABC-2 type transport system permease protein
MMKALIASTILEIKMFFRDFSSAFFTIVLPVFMLVLLGSTIGNEPTRYFSIASQNGELIQLGFIDHIVPALIYLIMVMTGIMILPVNIAHYREGKILKRMKTTPVSPVVILLSQAITMIIVTLIGSTLVLLVAMISYDINIVGNIGSILIALTIGLIMNFSIGIFIASTIKSQRRAQVVSNLIYYPMMVFSGSLIPIKLMPPLIQKVVNVLPGKHAMELISLVWHDADARLFATFLPFLLIIEFVVVIGFLGVFRFSWTD